MKKILAITHGDMDGITSALLLLKAKGIKEVGKGYTLDFNIMTGGRTTDDMILKYKEAIQAGEYKAIHITDRSFIKEWDTIWLIEDSNVELVYIDHHVTSKEVEELIDDTDSYLEHSGFDYIVDTTHSATKLVLENYKKELYNYPIDGYNDLINSDKLYNLYSTLANGVDAWDTFKWKNPDCKYIDEALGFQSLATIHGNEVFKTLVENIIFANKLEDATKTYHLLSALAKEAKKMNETKILLLMNFLDKYEVSEEKVFENQAFKIKYIPASYVDGVTFSLLADSLFSKDKNLAYVVRIGDKSFSIRRNSTHENVLPSCVTLSRSLANHFNGAGGGHPNAAGGSMICSPDFTLIQETLSKIIDKNSEVLK